MAHEFQQEVKSTSFPPLPCLTARRTPVLRPSEDVLPPSLSHASLQEGPAVLRPSEHPVRGLGPQPGRRSASAQVVRVHHADVDPGGLALRDELCGGEGRPLEEEVGVLEEEDVPVDGEGVVAEAHGTRSQAVV